MTHEVTIKLLQQLHKRLTQSPALFPKVPPEDKIKEIYYVEYHFLRHYVKSDHVCIAELRTCSGDIIQQDGISIQLFEDDRNGKITRSMLFMYFDGKEGPAGEDHGLIITGKIDTICYRTYYKRKPGQNQKTEWIKNQLANLRSSETGQLIFGYRDHIAC